MKSSIHEDTLSAIRFALEFMENNEWVEKHHYHGNYYAMECSECHESYREGTSGYLNYEERKHREGCRLKESMDNLTGFVLVENQLEDV